MRLHLSRPVASLVLAFAAGLIALPACDKKKDTPSDSKGPPPDAYKGQQGYMGSKGGPPGGMPMPPGGGTPGTGQPTDPTLPAPPTGAPFFKADDARSRLIAQNDLKQISLAFHSAADTYGGSIPIGIADKSGKIGLSWRVAILPFIQEVNLYKEFKLDEPWDSENNKKLIAKMPKLFAPPGIDTKGYTYYRSFSGPGTVMAPGPKALPGQTAFGIKLTQITDGTSNTLLAVEATDPVIWTKPDELPYENGKPLPKVGGVFDGGVNAALCDGVVRFVKLSDLTPDTLKALITTNGGEIVKLP